MNLPPRPTFQPLPCITPSQVNMGLSCRAKVVFGKHYKRQAFPSTVASVLGQAFHATVEEAAKGLLPREPSARRMAARQRFAEAAQNCLADSHPYLRARYGRMENMPGFYRQQERAAALSVFIGSSTSQDTGAGDSSIISTEEGRIPSGDLHSDKVEWSVASRDGLIKGRIDRVDAINNEVIDYKSGMHDGRGVSEPELRQLLIYAHLCREEGFPIHGGMIVRADGRTDRISICQEDADGAAQAAKQLLASINENLCSGGIASLGDPQEHLCDRCPFTPVCEKFWMTVSPDWGEASGAFLAGEVVDAARIYDDKTGRGRTTLRMWVHQANSQAKEVTVGPLPLWAVESDNSLPIQVGDYVRVTGVFKDAGTEDRFAVTSAGAPCVWRVEKPRE